jgi:hypothetical protein
VDILNSLSTSSLYLVLYFITILLSGLFFIKSGFAVNNTSTLSQTLFFVDSEKNKTCSNRHPNFETKNNVAGFDLPISSDNNNKS